MKTHLIDTLVTLSAKGAANRISRRGFAKFGLRWGSLLAVAQGIAVTLRPMRAEAQAGCAVANANCGVNGSPCSNWRQNPSPACNCSQCQSDTVNNGCPAGTTKRGAWIACCACANNASQGAYMTYTDCCGTPDPVKCKCCTRGDHYPNGGGGTRSWCGTFGGSDVCTLITGPTGTCTPSLMTCATNA